MARGVRSPGAALVAAGAGGVAFVAGLGIPGALAAAVCTWVLGVVVATLRHAPRQPGPDPFAVGEPWRRYVMATVRHQRRFDEACSSLPEGPLRQRFASLTPRVDEAAGEVWAIAQSGHRLSRARRAIGPAEPASAGTGMDPLQEEALTVHQDATGRLEGTIAATERRLAALDAQLGAVVTRAIEVSATAATAVDLGGVETDLAQLVDEMEALRLALDDLDGGGSGGTGGVDR